MLYIDQIFDIACSTSPGPGKTRSFDFANGYLGTRIQDWQGFLGSHSVSCVQYDYWAGVSLLNRLEVTP